MVKEGGQWYETAITILGLEESPQQPNGVSSLHNYTLLLWPIFSMSNMSTINLFDIYGDGQEWRITATWSLVNGQWSSIVYSTRTKNIP